jgi:hypothetical protein
MFIRGSGWMGGFQCQISFYQSFCNLSSQNDDFLKINGKMIEEKIKKRRIGPQ